MATLTPAVIDLESFWSTTHSLSKMNPIAYCTHKDTEVISCAIKIGDAATYVVFGEDKVKAALSQIDWSDKIVVAHNMSGFDAMILAWRCGVRPAMWGCTLAMARPHHAQSTGLGLGKLVTYYGLGVKDNTALVQTKGKHLKDFTPEEVNAMRTYNKGDTDQCAALFKKLLPLTSKDEMRLIDMTIRMLVAPKFEVDTELLLTTLGEEKARKKNDLLRLASLMNHVTNDEDDAAEFIRSELASAPKFAARLISWGVEPPTKPSPTNPETDIYALAKSDQAFLDLQDHPHPLVAAATRARLDVKSTILESRIESFLEVAGACHGRMPIAKNYYGAHTGRWSGAMGLNQENLPRIPRDKEGKIIYKPTNALRLSLMAPKGKKVVVADLSGIELRVNMFLWRVEYAMDLFKADPEKADLYKTLASEVLGVPYDEIVKMQRQAGKAMHLGCGFGLGSPDKYVAVAKQMAQIDVSIEDALDHIAGYRKKHPEIVRGWRTCHNALDLIYQESYGLPIDPWGLCTTAPDGIKTPKGVIRYPGLHKELADGKEEWWYGEGRHRTRIYAGKIDENIVQHLARCILADNALEVKRQTGELPTHTVHDELIYVVNERKAESHLETVQSIMRTPPKWWPELVTWSEGDIADTYGAAK